MKILKKFNYWYDGLKEPWRILVGLFLACIPILLLSLTTSIYPKVIGCILIFLILYVRISEKFYEKSNSNN